MAKKINSEKIVFYPRKDKVVLAAARRENKIILLNDKQNEDGVTYDALEVVSWGPLVEGLKVGDKIKLSDSVVAQPMLLYCNYNENDSDDGKKKIDYLLVSDAFIQGVWGNID